MAVGLLYSTLPLQILIAVNMIPCTPLVATSREYMYMANDIVVNIQYL